MFGLGKPKIVDPFSTMGTAPRQPGRARPRAIPASVDDGDLADVPLEDIARAHGLTMEAAGWFRDAWNDASRYGHTARGRRAMDDLGDIGADRRTGSGGSGGAVQQQEGRPDAGRARGRPHAAQGVQGRRQRGSSQAVPQ